MCKKTSIKSINPKYREDNNEDNNKNISVHKRVYSKNGIYNCKRGACIANNSICIDVISIISKSEKEDENNNVFIRG